MRVTELIQTAFVDGKSAPLLSGYSRQRLHLKRSEAWVKALARHLEKEYPRERFRVFSKHDDTNRDDFGLNELLFDIAVCEVGKMRAAKATAQLVYVKRAVWQVESEFAKDSRAAVLDFSKLVLGCAPNKLFVAPLTHDTVAFRDALLPVAGCCSGRVFLAVLPHPENWEESRAPEVYCRSDGQWVPCGEECVRDDGRLSIPRTAT
ncbi:MAG: hypothetical protein ABSE73_04605 [Planctomycetota bacterium]